MYLWNAAPKFQTSKLFRVCSDANPITRVGFVFGIDGISKHPNMVATCDMPSFASHLVLQIMLSIYNKSDIWSKKKIEQVYTYVTSMNMLFNLDK